VRFPMGTLTKDEVRAHAVRLGLPNAAKDESQEICFVPDGDYAGFVAASALRRGRVLPRSGEIIDADGSVVGTHDGTHRYTVGQHKGLGNLSTRERRFVTAIEPETGTVRVGPRHAAERRALDIRDLRWLAPARETFDATIQVRHRGTPIGARIDVDGTRALAELAEPVVAAPGQAAVCYDGDRVLAGGWIEG
jgi:tRNA-uridine 2-sulfurtransferase